MGRSTLFMQGVERALQAVLKGLDAKGMTEAHAFVKETFQDPIKQDQEKWALEELFGVSLEELRKNR